MAEKVSPAWHLKVLPYSKGRKVARVDHEQKKRKSGSESALCGQEAITRSVGRADHVALRTLSRALLLSTISLHHPFPYAVYPEPSF